MSDPTEKQPWHVEKGVSLPFLALIVIQTVGIVAWAAVLDHRVSTMEVNLSAVKTQLTQAEVKISSQSSDIAVVTSQLQNIDRQLNRVETRTEETYNLIRQYLSNGGRQ